MPTFSTIKDIYASEDDQPIFAIRGKLTKLFPQKTNPGPKGDWTAQQGEIEDATGKIGIKIIGKDELPQDLRGKNLCILCHKGDKGWTGVKAKINTYQPEKYGAMYLHVTSTAEIEVIGSGSQVEQPPAKGKTAKPKEPPQPPDEAPDPDDDGRPPEPPPEKQTPPAVVQTPTKTEYDSVEAVIDARKMLARRGNGMRMAADEAVRTIVEFRRCQGLIADEKMINAIKEEVAQEMTRTIFTTMFISLDRNAGIMGDIPTANLEGHIEVAKKRLANRKAAADAAKENPSKPNSELD